jgi:hypothetical protein
MRNDRRQFDENTTRHDVALDDLKVEITFARNHSSMASQVIQSFSIVGTRTRAGESQNNGNRPLGDTGE